MRVMDVVGLGVQKLEPSVMEEERGEQSDKGSDRTKKLVFRHYCRSKMIGVLNERLTIEQKGYIEKSVFGWLLYLPSSIKIGLPVVGEAIDLNKVGHRSVCREYFPEGKVDVRMVYEFLLEEHQNFPIEHFCSLYILVGISEFLVPNRSGVVFPIIFDLVSEFGSVPRYNWGSLVFQYFVESVCAASTTMKNETTKSHIHVQGCAYLLQVWFCHHFVTSKSIYSTRVTKFPRLLNWIDINIGDKFMKSALAKGSVVIDVGVSKEELCYGMVKDACEKFGIPFKKQNRGDKEKLLFVVEEQTRVIADMQSSINDLRKLVQAKNEDKNEEFVEEPVWGREHGCQSTPVQHDQQTPVAERGFKMQQSGMYDRMKAQPRIRVKSVVKRSPYTAGRSSSFRSFRPCCLESLRTLVVGSRLAQDGRPCSARSGGSSMLRSLRTFVLDPVAQDGRPYCARSGRSSMLRSLRTLVLAPLALKRSATVLYRPVPFSPPPISSSLVNSPGPNSFHV
ncbi:uncharacterized protein HKW66_Vig0248890 [Vigna angularis]|uniref:Aminotransferase-like plant mobile domain-containing protein n=1 Tax=Phaseolus angularis TaxID=3914 RepID=A0A8T0JUQ2_PHAAN|nr:uncharacterized protein HKW66_Vig0248890 [Vigna angularis]